MACTEAPVEFQLYVVDRGGNQIHAYDSATWENRGQFAQHTSLESPSGIHFASDGFAYVPSFRTGNVWRLHGETGVVIGSLFSDRRILEEPVAISIREDRAFVVGNDTNNVVELDMTGAVMSQLWSPRMRAPHDLAWHSAGYAYVATSGGSTSAKVFVWNVQAGEIVAEIAHGLSEATSVAIDSDDTVYAVDAVENTIHVVERNGVAAEEIVVIETGTTAPRDIVFTPDGGLVVLDQLGVIVAKPGQRAKRVLDASTEGWIRARSLAIRSY